jgi:hypothetical protein
MCSCVLCILSIHRNPFICIHISCVAVIVWYLESGPLGLGDESEHVAQRLQEGTRHVHLAKHTEREEKGTHG